MKRRILLLDLDGTIVDSVPDLRSSLNRLMVSRGLEPFAVTDVTAMVGDGAAALVRKAFARRGTEPGAGDLDRFLADYTAHSAIETRPYPGAVATIDALRAAGWRLGLCTNKPEAATRALLAALGLLDRFEAIAGGDSQPTRKPDPGHILDLLARMGAPPQAAVMVGDHHNDVLAATGAGVPCIFAAWGYGTVNMAGESVAIAGDFAAIPGLLQRIA